MNRVIHEDLKYATENKIKQLLEENQGDITGNTLEALGDLMDIHKDICNEKYWYTKEESEEMYGNYPSRNYGRYDRDDHYGRRERDSRGRYRGHDHLDRMYDYYGRYMEGHDRYGASEDTKRSLEYMLRSMEDFAHMLKEDAKSNEEVQMIRETAHIITIRITDILMIVF